MPSTDNGERRLELAAKVAMLEERSLQNQKQMDRIEAMLVSHSHNEEALMQGILKSLVDFKDDYETKLVEAIEPIKMDIIRYKGIIGGITLVVSVLWAGISLFKDSIVSWFRN